MTDAKEAERQTLQDRLDAAKTQRERHMNAASSHNGTRKPFRFLLNRSAATAPNVYLMLYPRPSLSKLLKAKPSLNQAVWQALNQIPVAALVGEGRVYGGGLYKIEPKELGNAPAEGVVAVLGAGGDGRGRQRLLFQ